jgi:hypothetical protein
MNERVKRYSKGIFLFLAKIHKKVKFSRVIFKKNDNLLNNVRIFLILLVKSYLYLPLFIKNNFI